GIPIPFFGHDAMTTTVPAEFAIRYKIPLVPARVERVSGARFRLTISPPLTLPDSGDLESDARAVMAEVHSLFESWIRDKPEQWLWLHRRWPDNF
ncbi:MAG TPA: lauroyl acyltransferase, partial [Alphaproteobacteria bacterium]|nr:lauroyl acyltransferase [Alphaproteobacteria bacterium]